MFTPSSSTTNDSHLVNLLDSSTIFQTNSADVLDTSSPSMLGDQQNVPQQQFSSLHFMDKSDLLIKLSRIIFDDFHNHILSLNSSSSGNDVINGGIGGIVDGEVQVEQQQPGRKEELFLDTIQKFLEIAELGVRGVEKICSDAGQVDAHSKMMMNQLSLERAAYSLVLRMHKADKLLSDNENLISTSSLTKLFRENEQFRRISTLLLWSEECSVFSGTEFSRIADEDAMKLSELDNVYACTKIRGPVHVDSRFVDRIAAEDEEAVQTLNRVLFALLRSGRLQDAKALLDNVGLPALAAFLLVREFLTNQKLSPLDPFDENASMAQSRLHFKQAARELIPTDDERIQQTDQCIWATLGGHLPTLLAYAQGTEDRLWAYLSCAAEALMDEALAGEALAQAVKMDEQLGLMAMDMAKEGEDVPRDVHTIFGELRNNEASAYYALFELLALGRWAEVAELVERHVLRPGGEEQQVPAHELRFYIHLLLLLKLTGNEGGGGRQQHGQDQQPEPNEADDGNGTAAGQRHQILDRLICQYTDVLAEMRLNGSVPLYLFHLSDRAQAQAKMLDFLEGLQYEPEQKEVLQSALNAGFDVPQLCRDVFRRFKAKHRIHGAGANANQSEEQIATSAEALIRAWRWLIYCGPETVWDAILEANFLLRKLFLTNRMAEAIELMRMAPGSLSFDALDAFAEEFPGMEVPQRLLDAKHELECYQFYFEAISRYGEWQKQVEGGQAPEIPAKLSDERWARMDIRRRAEYELNVKRARECLQKYYRLVELCKKRAVEMLESVLKTSTGWLVSLPLPDEDTAEADVLERARDFVSIRKHYLAHLLELLVDIHRRSDEPLEVLAVASLLMDPEYSLYKALDKAKLQKLLTKISRSGAALLI